MREDKDGYEKESRQQKHKRKTGTKKQRRQQNVREGRVRKTESSAKM